MIEEIDISDGWMMYKYTSNKGKVHTLNVDFESDVKEHYIPADWGSPSEGETIVKVSVIQVSAYLEDWDYSRKIKVSKELLRDLKDVIKDYINEN